jgi:EAL domain-containing protein (putative c-di-GMP-specific phosphodiesterase class I)
LLTYFSRWGDGESSLRVDASGAWGRFGDLRLRSVFQPLLHARTLLPLAHEALLRAWDGAESPVSPQAACNLPQGGEEVVFFDRLCRSLHALNFARQSGGQGILYLNISGRHLLNVGQGGHGKTFEALLGHCGLQPAQIVLEILEADVDNLDHLQAAISAYRQRGYRVAIDDFGSQHSNFDRLWRLEPDIVKLDRQFIVQAGKDARAGKILPKLIDIIHDLGAQVVCEGIETAEQHALVVAAGTDIVQGFFYVRPQTSLYAPPENRMLRQA